MTTVAAVLPTLPPVRRPGLGARVAAHVRLVRPFNAAMSAAGVLVGAVVAAGAPAVGVPGAWRAALAATCLGSAANALNDSHDVATDRVNRPDRPIPSGMATVTSAHVLWAVLTLVGLVLAASVSAWHAAVAGTSAVLLALYTRHLKPCVLLGNLAVSAVVAMALPFGGRAATGEAGGAATALALATAFAFLATLVREIVKDVEDVRGDAAAGMRTLPVVVGSNAANAVAVAVLGVVLVALPLPVALAGVSETYYVAALGAGVALLGALRSLLAGDATGASRALKVSMLAGLVAFVLGAVG